VQNGSGRAVTPGVDAEYPEVRSVKTVEQINEKIRRKEAVVLTAEEVVKLAEKKSPGEIARDVDVVTTGTFSPMCSSGAFINFGHTDPPMRMEEITLGGVQLHGGLAAVDAYIGATQELKEDKAFGGAHVIEALVRGERLPLRAKGKGTDCYPRREYEGFVDKGTLRDFFLFNPRNACQNYAVAVNGSDRTIYTYMGKILPGFAGATYSTSGELSPLLKDPGMRTVGLGTRIFLCGNEGYVAWQGTQFRSPSRTNAYGVPVDAARTLSVVGDARYMNPRYIRAAYFKNYGVTLFVGIGIPIPILDEGIALSVSRSNEQIETEIKDYSKAQKPVVGYTNYAQLQSGWVEINGKKARTSSLSSLYMAREIAGVLKEWVRTGSFELTSPSHVLGERALQRGFGGPVEDSCGLGDERCLHCGACVSLCMPGALTLEQGRVSFDSLRCNGCGECSDSCPLGVKLPPQ
jgi:uncharacterized protein (DUF39 family)/NAD-dependent dihydropyrimidine dehydrogenase PreA subunit